MVVALKSFTNTETYSLVINERSGDAAHCTCKSFQFGRKATCKHCDAFNAEVQRAASFILLQNKIREMEYTWKANREMAFDIR